MLTGLAFGGLVVGLPCGWLVGHMMKAAKVQHLPWADEFALALAMAFLAMGALMGVLALNRRGRAILANPSAPEFDVPVRPAEVLFFWLQAGVLVLAGLMLVAPVVVGIATHGAPAGLGLPTMVAITASFGLQTALNLMIWHRGDEVLKQVIVESAAATFWLLQGAFFLWAAGEKLKVLPTLSSWDAITVLMAVYLVMSSILGFRRGLG
jgi:hypothetical protein